jgi:hypothetical protein
MKKIIAISTVAGALAFAPIAHADPPSDQTPAPANPAQATPVPAEAPALTGDYDDGDIWIVF